MQHFPSFIVQILSRISCYQHEVRGHRVRKISIQSALVSPSKLALAHPKYAKTDSVGFSFLNRFHRLTIALQPTVP